MIELRCTSCGVLMIIDDGFAGGVCRCQECGTIQTVPDPKKPQAVGKQPVAELAKSPKALYKTPQTRLREELEQTPSPTAPPPAAPDEEPDEEPVRQSRHWWILIVLEAILLTAAILAGLWIFWSRRSAG